MHPKTLYLLARKAVTAWVDDYASSMGAAIAYYTVFSFAPLLVIVIAVAGIVFSREAVEGQLVSQLTGLIGREGAVGLQALIRSANEPEEGLIATAISAVVLVVGATTVFSELQSALDRIWRVPAHKQPSGIWSLLRSRLLSFGLILGLGFLMLVSTVMSAGLSAFGTWAESMLPASEWLLRLLSVGVSITLSTLLFAMIYKIMPSAKIAWRDVWTGAVVTALLFEVGRYAIGMYIGRSSVTSSFAAAGSLVVLLVWVYYSAQVFLLGAEFTWVYAQNHGSHAVKPTPAVPEGQPQKQAGGVADAGGALAGKGTAASGRVQDADQGGRAVQAGRSGPAPIATKVAAVAGIAYLASFLLRHGLRR